MIQCMAMLVIHLMTCCVPFIYNEMGRTPRTIFSRYGNSNYKDKTVSQQSYLYDGVTYTGKTTSLY